MKTKQGKRKRSKSRRRRRRSRNQTGYGNFLNRAINNLPIELHWPGHNFTGPGTKLPRRLNKKDQPRKHSVPVNRVDQTSMKHDICYRDNKSRKGRTRCDWNMVKGRRRLKKPSLEGLSRPKPG